MAKNKTSEIPHYELLYIVSNKFSEDEVTPIAEKIKALITDGGGEITYTENWGKKRLAYPIQSFGYGYYNLVNFDIEGEKLAKVERNIKLMAEVLRHQIVKISTRITEKQIKIERPVEEVKTEVKKPVKEKAKEKTDLKDLDEKLDKILETNDLL